MKIMFNVIMKLAELKNLSELAKSKDSALVEVKANYDKQFALRSKLKTRVVNDKEIRYSSQDTIQARVQDDFFVVENIKTTAVSMTRLHDSIELSKADVKQLLNYFADKDFAEYKRVFRNLSMFVLFTHSNSTMNKHERFYSQCLEQFDYLLNKFYVECEKSRSKNIVVKEKTLSRRSAEHENIINLLNVANVSKLKKTKTKTAKIVKVKKAKKVKVTVK